jgi:2-aminoadipate transaminase
LGSSTEGNATMLGTLTSRDLHNMDLYTERGLNVQGSPIDALRSAEGRARGQILSLSHGSPSPEALPVAEVARISQALFASEGPDLLNYSDSEGDLELRELIAGFYVRDGLELAPENVLVTTGATQGFDLALKLFLDPGDTVIVESPSFPNYLAAFRNYGARLLPVPLDEQGLNPERVAAAVEAERRNGGRPKLLYTIPTFQNPSGLTLSLERRRALVELAHELGLLIFEDDPYVELRFAGERLPSLLALDGGAAVISCSCFTKTIAAGIRVGWVAAAAGVIERLVQAKMLNDNCTPLHSQRVAARFVAEGLLPAQIAHASAVYQRRKQALTAALARHFGDDPRVTWTDPQGGFFLWLAFEPEVETRALLDYAIEEAVSFVPGVCFDLTLERSNACRLSFSYSPLDSFDEAARRLRRALERYRAATGLPA